MFTPSWQVVPGEQATAVKMSQLGANDDYLKDAVDKSVATGTIVAFAGSTAPAGWLICDGSAVSRSTYAALFAVLGTSRGVGDGINTFNLPNLRGRTIVGVDPADGNINAIGKQYGSKTVVLTEGQMPRHNHPGNTTVNGFHGHGLNVGGNSLLLTSPGGTNNRVAVGGSGQQLQWGGIGVNGDGNHNHAVETHFRGDNEPHNNMQPSDAEYIIIKY